MRVVAVKDGSQWRVTVSIGDTALMYWQSGRRADAIRDAVASAEMWAASRRRRQTDVATTPMPFETMREVIDDRR